MRDIFTTDLFDYMQVNKEENVRHKVVNKSIEIETERVEPATVTSNKTLTNQGNNI